MRKGLQITKVDIQVAHGGVPIGVIHLSNGEYRAFTEHDRTYLIWLNNILKRNGLDPKKYQEHFEVGKTVPFPYPIQVQPPKPEEQEQKEEATYKNKEWLIHKYVVEGLLKSDIAKQCDVTVSTITYWLGKYQIWNRRRSTSSAVE